MAESFRDFLARMGETQTSFSRRFGIPLRTVQGWALGERACPKYLKAMALAESFRDFLARMGETQTSFSRRFNIPLRTVQGWALGERACPEYLKNMAEEILGGAKKGKGEA